MAWWHFIKTNFQILESRETSNIQLNIIDIVVLNIKFFKVYEIEKLTQFDIIIRNIEMGKVWKIN